MSETHFSCDTVDRELWLAILKSLLCPETDRNIRRIGRQGYVSVADPDLKLRGGPGLDILALSAIFPSVISSFSTQNKGGGGWAPRAPPLDPPLCVYFTMMF